MRLLLTALILGIFFCIPFLIWGGDFIRWFSGEAVIAWIREWGPWGRLAIVVLLMSDLILPIPATAVIAAAGYLYGAAAGGLIAATGSFCAGMVGYGACRAFGRGLALRLVGNEALEEHATLFQKSGPWLVAASRWLPILPEVVSCLAGLTRMPLRVFATALACGSLPLGFVYATIGASGHTHPRLALLLSMVIPPLLWALIRPLTKPR